MNVKRVIQKERTEWVTPNFFPSWWRAGGKSLTLARVGKLNESPQSFFFLFNLVQGLHSLTCSLVSRVGGVSHLFSSTDPSCLHSSVNLSPQVVQTTLWSTSYNRELESPEEPLSLFFAHWLLIWKTDLWRSSESDLDSTTPHTLDAAFSPLASW